MDALRHQAVEDEGLRVALEMEELEETKDSSGFL